ncbi:amino acid transporter [Boletus coccyginus]|nr:amino acid transporter [Boletus coccyginus]
MASDHASSGLKFVEEPPVHTALHRKLKNRHVAMISIGGVIGTGLFIGTATPLMDGGPLGILLGYLFMGTICFATMVSLGEMIAFLPLPGGFIKLAERFVDPAFAFAIGWNYWYQWTLTLPAELSAADGIIGHWYKTMPKQFSAIWISVGLVIAIGINSLGVGAYGEAEFWFSSIKVVTIVGMIIVGIVVDLGGNPKHDLIGFRYWKNPGPFTNYTGISGAKGQFLGTCSVLTQAMFAMAAAEARNPRRNIPKAIKRVYLRILIFYIGGVFIIGLLVASNDGSLGPTSESPSPFVIAFENAGMKVLSSIINGAILTSAWSAGSSDLYLASRSLYGTCYLWQCSKDLQSHNSALGYPTSPSRSHEVFQWFSGFASTSGLVTWFGIGVTYLRFYEGMKAQGIDRNTLPFAPRVQPYAGWWCVCGSALALFVRILPSVVSATTLTPGLRNWEVLLKNKWDPIGFFTDYIPIILFPILYVAAKLVMRVPTVGADKMDFVSNVAEFDMMTSKSRSDNAVDADL